jgi:serine/threonine protein kinase
LSTLSKNSISNHTCELLSPFLLKNNKHDSPADLKTAKVFLINLNKSMIHFNLESHTNTQVESPPPPPSFDSIPGLSNSSTQKIDAFFYRSQRDLPYGHHPKEKTSLSCSLLNLESGKTICLLKSKGEGQTFVKQGAFKVIKHGVDIQSREVVAVATVLYDRNTPLVNFVERELSILRLFSENNCQQLTPLLGSVEYKPHKLSRSPPILSSIPDIWKRAIVLPLYEKYDLFEVLDNMELLLRDKIQIGLDIVTGLTQLERNGIVHRDLKPENILLKIGSQSKLRAFIGDYGAAYKVNPLGQALDQNEWLFRNRKFGTVHYFAPENIEGWLDNTFYTNGFKSDIFSAGRILLEVFLGLRHVRTNLLLDLITKAGEDFENRQINRYKNENFVKRYQVELEHLRNSPNTACSLAADCLQLEPSSRPSSQELLDRMMSLKP